MPALKQKKIALTSGAPNANSRRLQHGKGYLSNLKLTMKICNTGWKFSGRKNLKASISSLPSFGTYHGLKSCACQNNPEAALYFQPVGGMARNHTRGYQTHVQHGPN